LVCDIEGETQTEGVREQGAEENIWTEKKDEVTGGWRKLHNEELRNFYSLRSIIRMFKSWMTRWTGHVTLMREQRNTYRILAGKPEGNIRLTKPRRRRVDNIEVDLREIGWGAMYWIYLAQ
jgi:hypothetical protein